MARKIAIALLLFIIPALAYARGSKEHGALPGRKTMLDAEVVSVDPAKKEITLKFIRMSPLDPCEPDLESVTLTVNDKTDYQNVNSLAEIRAGAGVSVIYIAAGNNPALGIALNTSYYQGALDAQYARQRFDWLRGQCGQEAR